MLDTTARGRIACGSYLDTRVVGATGHSEVIFIVMTVTDIDTELQTF
jgi:hypothetical protein